MADDQVQAFTKTELLEGLRDVEKQLYNRKVEQQVQPLSLAERQQFVAARLHLTSIIATLNASLMRDIREDLEAQSASLRQGISDLDGSLRALTNAKQWASAVNGVIGLLGKIVSLL